MVLDRPFIDSSQYFHRTLLGVLLAAGLKLIIPFIIILPGIMAFHLCGHLMTGQAGTDAAYPLLIRNLVGPGARAFIFAAISGAVISSPASMLNSASTIFTMDIFKRHLKKLLPRRV